MTATDLHISERAAELRRAFDNSFVETQHFEPLATEDFLAVHAGGDPYMLRLSEIAGLYVDKKVTGLPSHVAELRGVAGFRGSMLPVYDLAALLGYVQSPAPRWIAIAAETPVALAFDSFDGHFRFRRDMIASHEGADAGGHLRQIVRTDDFVRPVIHVPSLVAAIRARAPVGGMQQEH